MDEIIVMEKPEWVTWDDVATCLHVGQATNINDGFDQTFGHITSSELECAVSRGHCWVAINADKKVVGTLSLIIGTINYWWYKGVAGLYCYETILPEYRHDTRVYFGLHGKIESFIKQEGLKLVWASTHEKNDKVQMINKKKKWKIVQYSPTGRGSNYYSVIMAKWMDGCPHSERRIKFMFKLSKYVVKFLYKPGKIFRWNPFNKPKKALGEQIHS